MAPVLWMLLIEKGAIMLHVVISTINPPPAGPHSVQGKKPNNSPLTAARVTGVLYIQMNSSGAYYVINISTRFCYVWLNCKFAESNGSSD
jgi:hypothetical protein